MSVEEVMAQLQALGDPKVRARNERDGAGGSQFGVKMGDLRGVAKGIKTDTALARELWTTGNVDAMLLATLVIRPKDLAVDELEAMVSSATYSWLADWLNAYVVKLHPQKEELRQKWMATEDVMCSRSGWSLTTERVAKTPEGLDIGGLLDRIEVEMGDAPGAVQWTMNACLAEIGIHFPDHRERALAIGEKLGVFRNFPTSKGCTSPFAPIWISEMVRRQGSKG